MKIAEIKELPTKELVERLEAAKTALNRMEINHSISPLDNPAQIKQSRKEIARMMSELRRRELNA
ncbi:MAG: 50S ribosomal protein L29 [Bacteroidetes bacterium]|uniref:Large ribosomal subunit protein uL29 n=1 Tax=Candidatus Caccoplasma merdipullorum TaxID=2840718 RepID=A0A9D9E3D4_9BACT|nr:50S ribosomal protein L29 [Candidatus Caccoplasma merdipullorum]